MYFIDERLPGQWYQERLREAEEERRARAVQQAQRETRVRPSRPRVGVLARLLGRRTAPALREA